MAHPFERFSIATDQITNQWDPDSVGYGLGASPNTQFEAAASAVRKQALEIDSAFGEMPISIGISVQFRFLHIAARTARQAKVPLEQLAHALRNDKTFIDTLGVVALSRMEHAFYLEESMGIRRPDDYLKPETLPYAVGDSVQIDSLLLRLKEIEFTMKQSDAIFVSLGMCPAHRYLPHIYQNMVSIALKDPHLINYVLSFTGAVTDKPLV